MKFNFFEGKKLAPKDNVEQVPESETEKDGKMEKAEENGEKQVMIEAGKLEEVKTKEGDLTGKKLKNLFIATLCGLTLVSCQHRAISNQFERSMLGGRTVDEIERKNREEVRENDRAQQEVTRNRIREIQNSNLPTELKRKMIENLTGLRR